MERPSKETPEVPDIRGIASPFGDLKEQDLRLPALASMPSIFTGRQETRPPPQAGSEPGQGQGSAGLQVATSPQPSTWGLKDTPMSPVSPNMPTVFKQRYRIAVSALLVVRGKQWRNNLLRVTLTPFVKPELMC